VRKNEIVGSYRVIDPAGFCGLPTAMIIEGSNAGIQVILTSAWTRRKKP
jgi:hypothetical protein